MIESLFLPIRVSSYIPFFSYFFISFITIYLKGRTPLGKGTIERDPKQSKAKLCIGVKKERIILGCFLSKIKRIPESR